ncbi:MAG: ribonuclease [Planctomycetota bacterium]
MTSTRVFQVRGEAAARLGTRLREQLPPDAEWRTVDHAAFAVKALGVNLVCYRSGKVVLQGKDIDGFVARFLGELDAVEPATQAAAPLPIPFDVPTIGSDEAGKGDYFGPLVVAAVHATPADEAGLRAMGVADSKTLGDSRMPPMAEHIERTLDAEVRVLMPEEYNARWQELGNVNEVLASMHADAIAALVRRHPEATVLVDQFSAKDLIGPRLQRAGAVPRRFVQAVRAEAHPVVAAASIVARVHFLEGMKRCEETCACDLHKGAGDPVDKAARRVVTVGGAALLARVAKMHFKNSERVGLGPR